MIRTLVRQAIRNLLHRKYISSISLIQLLVAFTAILSIYFYISNEFSYDKFHKDHQQKYMVYFDEYSEGLRDIYSSSPLGLGTNLIEDFPEVETMTRIRERDDNIIITPDKKEFKDQVIWADSNFYQIFDLQLIAGDYPDILNGPNKVCISDACASKYFGKENPLGKSLSIDGSNYSITGIFKKYPKQSHLSFDMIASIFNVYNSNDMHYWDGYMFNTYVKLHEGIERKQFESKLDFIIYERLAPFVEKEYGLDVKGWLNRGNTMELKIIPISKIRLHAFHISGFEHQNSIFSILIFIGVAVLIAILACLNFMNFNIGKLNAFRGKIGVRKTLGAHSWILSKEIFSEVFVLVFISSVLSLLLIYFIIPFINQVFNISIAYKVITLKLLFYVLAFDVLFSFLSGYLPSLNFTGKRVSKLINYKATSKRHPILKHGLVGFQFMITILVLISFMIINKQLRYVNSAELGFNDENVMIIKRADRNREKLSYFIDNLNKIPNVQNVTETNTYPSSGFPSSGLKLLHGPKGFAYSPQFIRCDQNLKDVLELKLKVGRWFDERGDENEIMINLKAAQTYNIMNNPVGQVLTNTENTRQYKVVGVFNNINFKSLHKGAEPLILYKNINSQWTRNILVRLHKTDSETIDRIKSEWKKSYGNTLFEYNFLEDEVKSMYNKEKMINKVILLLSILTLSILIMGLMGATFMIVGNKIKEIGVRKVNGAKISEVLAMINKNFVIWNILAFGITCPVAWYVMNGWLNNFAYKTAFSWWIFATAGIFTLLISMITVNWQSWRAARRNPVEALRYE